MNLARFNFAVQDTAGNVVDGAALTLTHEFVGSAGVAYSDVTGLVSLGSSWVAADGANAGFHTTGGTYRIDAVKGAFSRTWRYVQIGTAQATDVGIAGGTDGIRMVFSSTTTAADPGSGIFRANSATFASITALYLDNEAYGAASITAWLDSLDDGGTSVHRGVLRFEGSLDPLIWAEFNVTGSVTDSTGYRTIVVTPRAADNWPFISGDFFSVSANRTGISGANGVNGASALTVVRCAARVNVTVASGLEQGDTVDGVSLTAGDIVLLAGQTAPAENGPYVAVGAGAGAASRHTSFATYSACVGACFSVQEGTLNGRSIWQCTSTPGGTINVTALTFINKQFYRPGMTNGSIATSRSASAETFAVKTLRGADPSVDDPVFFTFDDGAGSLVTRIVTAALSVTLSSGSTLGATNAVLFKPWIVAFDDAGTVRLGVINCRSGVNIYPLGQYPFASSTAEGGAGAADSAQVFYTGTAVAAKAYIVLGYLEYTLATVGTWGTAPSRNKLYGLGDKLPGDALQPLQTNALTSLTTASTIPQDNTIPQSSEGVNLFAQAIVPTSAANILEVESQVVMANNTATPLTAALFQDAGANALAATSVTAGAANQMQALSIRWLLLAGTVSSTTLKINVGGTGGTTTINGSAGSQLMGGVMNSFIRIREIVT
jgi:hypothetical protein